MKKFKSLTTAVLAAGLFCLSFPQIAHAATHEGQSFTLPQLLVFWLVLIWYLYNHFKSHIMNFFKKTGRKKGKM